MQFPRPPRLLRSLFEPKSPEAPSADPSDVSRTAAPACAVRQAVPAPDGKRRVVERVVEVSGWSVFLLLIFVVLSVKVVTLRALSDGILFGTYSIVVTTYILSRFLLAYLHVPPVGDSNYEPTVSFVIPCYNEESNIQRTILNLLAVAYPRDKMDLCVVNDGSADGSLREIRQGAFIAKAGGMHTTVVDLKENRGKREAMAEGITRTRGEIVVLVDSDSFLERDSVRRMVEHFQDPEIAAAAGHAKVFNSDTNLLTRMQHVRYYIAFNVYKAAEALFGSVTCCSGCCSAYRRSSLEEVLEKWRGQQFLGVQCTYGDDRSLTNNLLRLGYRTAYVPDALSSTVVPDTWRVFLKQQLRWKKSWVRESLIAATFMYKRHPVMATSFYAGLILPLVSPAVVLRSLVWIPFFLHRFPMAYMFGLGVMAMIYGFYYFIHTKDRNWLFGIVFAALSTVFLIWQLPVAILTLKDGSWGTR